MSNERPDSDELRDPRVSGAYRDLARERPGATIDEAIMREARLSARRGLPRYSRWFRPMAWVATISLCLAIVIEVSQLPDVGDIEHSERLEKPAEAVAPRQDSSELRDAADEPGLRRDLAKDAASSDRKYVEYREFKLEAQATPADAPLPETAMPAAPVNDAASSLGAASSAEVQDLSMLREAEERARLQSGNVAQPVAARFAPAATEAADTEHYCDESETADPHDWLECIQRLERDGLLDAAQHERERLREAFPGPEFVSPDLPRR